MPGSGNKISGESASEASSGFSFPIMPSPNAAQAARAEFFSVEHGDRAAAHGGGVDADGMSVDVLDKEATKGKLNMPATLSGDTLNN